MAALNSMNVQQGIFLGKEMRSRLIDLKCVCSRTGPLIISVYTVAEEEGQLFTQSCNNPCFLLAVG